MKKVIVLAVSLLLLLFFITMNEEIVNYIAKIKYFEAKAEEKSYKYSDAERRMLQTTIAEEASKLRIEPIDAKVDRVWKAIPGYNGLEVDVEKTLAAALRTKPGPIPFIYKEIEPKIALADLGPYPIYRGNPNKKMVSLMINVAWGNEFIEPILNTLKQENVKATFFLDGTWLNKYPDIAKQIQADGHEMSNHAYTHPDMSRLSRQQAYDQISKTEALLKSTLDVNNEWFAPPSGAFNQTTIQVAAEQGLKTVLWTLDTVDWREPPAETILRKISTEIEPGALILMHPTASTRDAIGGIIAIAKSKGYAVDTVSQTLSTARTEPLVEGNDGF